MRQGEGVEPDTHVGTEPLGRALGGLEHLESCKGCCHWSRKLVTWEEQEARWGLGSMPSGAHKQKRAGDGSAGHQPVFRAEQQLQLHLSSQIATLLKLETPDPISLPPTDVFATQNP